MPDYKNTNGLIYTEEDIEALAKTANLSSEDYLSKHSKHFKPVGGVKKVEEEKEDPRWGEKKQTVKDGKFIPSELPKYEGKHVTMGQLTDYKWWRGEGDIIETLEDIYGDDFEFDDEVSKVGSSGLGMDKIRVYNKESKKSIIITLPTGLSEAGWDEQALGHLNTWDEVHQQIQDFIDGSNIKSDETSSKKQKQEFADDVGLNFEQEFGEDGFDVILKNDPSSSREARTLFHQSDQTEWLHPGFTPDIEIKNKHKSLNLQETLDLKSTITQHLNRAIEFPQAYDLELREEDKDTYGRILNDESAERVKWAVWKKLNEELPYMISKDQFTKIVGDFTTNNLLQTVIQKRNRKIELQMGEDSVGDIGEGTTGTDLLNKKHPFAVGFQNTQIENLTPDLKVKHDLIENKYKVAEAKYVRLFNERNEITNETPKAGEKYRELTRQMEAENQKMKDTNAEFVKMGDKYNSFWQGKTKSELVAHFIEAGNDKYRAEQKANAILEYDPNSEIENVMDTNPALNVREAYDLAMGNMLGQGINIQDAMKNTFITINNPSWFDVNEKNYPRQKEIVRLAKELNLVEYYPDGKMKSIKVSVHDALTGLGYNGRQFDSAWNPLDKSFGPHLPKGQVFGEPGRKWISDQDVNVLKDMEATFDRNNLQTKVLWDVVNLNIGPKDIKKSSWVGNTISTAIEESGKMFFNMSPHEAAKASGNFASTFGGGRHDNFSPRIKLDQFHTIAAQHNEFNKDKIATGEIQPIMFTDDELEHIEKSFGEQSSEMLGGFVPILAKLGAITLATRGIGTIPAIARVANTIKAAKHMSTWGKVQYHVASAALLEAQMRVAGFKATSGLAFYTGGQLGGMLKLGGWLAAANPIFQKTLVAGTVGAGSMEFAGITELGWDVLKGEKNWKTHFDMLYGDHDEIEARILSSALAFGINGLHKVNFKRDFLSKRGMLRVEQKIAAKQRKIIENYQTEKPGDYKKILNALKEIERYDGDLPKGFEKLSKKHRDNWLTLEHSKQSVKEMRISLELNKLLDKNLPKEVLLKNVKEIIGVPFNRAMKTLTDGAHTNVEIDFIDGQTWKNPKTGKMEQVSGFWDAYEVLGKDGIIRHEMRPSKDEARLSTDGSNKMIFSKQAFHNGKVVHEFTHIMLKALFKGNKELENRFTNKMRSIFSEYEFHVGEDAQGNLKVVSGKEMAAQIKEEYGIDYRKRKGKDLANEEFLAFMGEFLASPEMYHKYVAPGFFSSIKQEVVNTFSGSGYTPKITEPMDLIKVFANFGRATQRGSEKQMLQNARALINLREIDFLGIEAVVNKEGGVEAMKQKSKRLFDKELKQEQEKIELKERETELKESLKEEGNKFIKSKKGLDPIKDKEKIATKRAEYQENISNIKEQLTDIKQRLTGKRDYNKEINSYRSELVTKGKSKEEIKGLVNKKIAELNEIVKQEMLDVRGIERVPEIHVERNKINRRIARAKSENKQPSKKDLDRLKEINKIVDWKQFNKLSGDLFTINAGRIEAVAQKAYEMGANFGAGRIGKSRLKSALNLEFQKIINTYEWTNPKNFKAEFGAYMQPALGKRIGAAYKAEAIGAPPKDVTVVGLEKAERIADVEGPRQYVSDSKGKVLTEVFNIDKDIVDKIESKINRLDFETLSYKTLNDLTPEVTNNMFGVTPKTGNLQRGSVENAQDFIDLNAKTLIDLLPKGAVPMEGAPEFLKGTSTGVVPKLLEAFYVKSTERVATGPGGYSQTKAISSKNKNDVAKFKEYFGINKDGTRSYDRNLSAKVKGIVNETGKAVTNQIVTKAIESGKIEGEKAIRLNIANFANQVSTGKSESLASKKLFDHGTRNLLKRKTKITVGTVAQMLQQKQFSEKVGGYTAKDRAKFLQDMTRLIKAVDISDAAGLRLARDMEVREAIVEVRETKNISEGIKRLSEKYNLKIEDKKMSVSEKKEHLTHEDSYNYNDKDIAEGNEMSIHISNIFPKNVPDGILTTQTRTLYHGADKVMGERRKKTKKENQRASDENYFVEHFGDGTVHRIGSGKGYNGEYEAVHIANPGQVKGFGPKKKNKVNTIRDQGLTGWLLMNEKPLLKKDPSGKLLGEKVSEGLVDVLTKPGISSKTGKPYTFQETIDANKILRRDYYHGLFDILDKANRGKLRDSTRTKEHPKGKKISLDKAVEGIIRHLQQQTNISTGIPKGTATILYSFFNLGKPTNIKGKDVYFHSEHNMQLLNHTFSFLDAALKNIKNKTQFEKEFNVIDREFHQALVLKELQQIYDGAGHGGPTSYSKEFMEGKLGEISSIVNFMIKNNLSHKVLYLPGPKGGTVADFLVKTYLKKSKQLETQAKVTQHKRNMKLAKNGAVPIHKNATNAEVLKSMRLFEEAKNEGRKKDKKRKGMSAWDFDDTLAKTKSGVRYTLPNPSGKPAPKKKVIFMAGGPGAGKSSVIKGLGLEAQGFKIVNQDISLQWLAKNHGLPTDMRDFTPEQASKWGSLGWDARMIAKRKQTKYQGKGDGIIVDGTGSSFKSMEAQRMEFLRKGYDVHMLFVETSKAVAVERNRLRKERSLRTGIVERTWDNVMKNKDRFQKPDVFGENFTLIKTDKLKQTDPIPADVVNKMDAFTKGYIKGRLDAGEYANKGTELEAKGAKFDFTEFDYVKEGEKGPLFGKAMDRAKKYGVKDQFIITARPHAAQMPIYRFLDAQGLKIPFENIITLENSSAEAKAMFMLEKFKEGYNDMYFADDAMQNVKAVKNVLDQLDIKSEVQQAKMASKKLFESKFGKIIEETTGFKEGYKIGQAKAAMLGEKKGTKTAILPGGQDFMGLMYNFMGKGKQGEGHKAWVEKHLNEPYARGYSDMLSHRQGVMDDFKRLKQSTPEINGKLTIKGNKYRYGGADVFKLKTPTSWKEVPGTKYSYEHAVRAYLWNKSGFKIDGLSKTDKTKLVETVEGDPILKNYADQLGSLSKESKGYIEPGQYWFNETIMSDIYKLTQERGTKRYLAEWVENKNAIFTEGNLRKIEATQGKDFRDSLENMLWRMEHGTNRPTGMSRESAMFMNWINGTVGATMHWNMRSSIVQQLSTINFMNWTDNNPLMAAKAFVNQPQFWKDYSRIWNSSMLRQRRKGLKINVQESEIADAVSSGGVRGAFNYFLKLGFTPTMIADSHAISFGGATLYRNRLNTYKKKGMSEVEAEKQAFLDFQKRSEPTQQSSRPDLVSRWQADTWLGRLMLHFANVNMQNGRRGEKGARDAINKRGDMKENISRVGNYGLLQPMLYGALSAGLIGLYLDEDDDFTEKEKKDKKWRFANTALDSQLRGLGYPGAIVSGMKNSLLEYHKQEQRPRHLRDHTYTLLQATSASPAVSIKLRNIYGGLQTFKYNEAVIEEMPFWDLDNPAWMARAQIVQGVTNAPTGRYMYKRMNMKEAVDANNQWWQQAHHAGGWAPWDLGTELEEIEMYKELIKQKKKKEKEREREKKKKKSTKKRYKGSSTGKKYKGSTTGKKYKL